MALRNLAGSTLSALGLRPLVYGRADVLQHAFRCMSSVVDGLKYAKSHEWAKVEGDVATIGISDHAQSALGDIVYVDLPEVGKELGKGDTFGVVESVKAASDVYAPVSGEVVEVNAALTDSPATLNKDPYKAGWMIKVKMANQEDTSDLLDADAYAKHADH